MSRVLVCCGVGGCGKTTLSAALATGHALAGARVVVLTIDPARRLADALGVDGLDNTPRAVEVPGAAGTLHALMLDRKGTWDELVRRRASPQTAERLFANRYYRAVSTRLTGSHEYMAVEKLHELVTADAYDVLVVDTPPTQHVVDFFRAPQRVASVLDRTMFSALLDPGRSLRGVATRGALSIVERLAGEGVMTDIREFFVLIAEMSKGLRERAAEVEEMLTSPMTRYLLVADANAPERNDLLGFLAEIRGRGMTLEGFLVNRVQPFPPDDLPTAEALRAAAPDLEGWDRAVEALVALPVEARERAHAHLEGVRTLMAAGGGAPAWTIPDVPGGVRSIEGLVAVSAHLPPAGRPQTL